MSLNISTPTQSHYVTAVITHRVELGREQAYKNGLRGFQLLLESLGTIWRLAFYVRHQARLRSMSSCYSLTVAIILLPGLILRHAKNGLTELLP